MKRNRDDVQQRETAGMVWTNRGELLVYGDSRLTEKNCKSESWGVGVVCALNSQRRSSLSLGE